MEPPPPRPRPVTFVALLLGFLGAALMAPSLLAIPQTVALFPGLLGGALAVGLVAGNAALVAAAVGLWWLRDWGRRLALVGLALRIVHDLAFALHPAQASVRGPYLLGVAVYAALAAYLATGARRAFRQ